MLTTSKSVNYRNFGFIPRKNFKENVARWLFGEANLFKRLQARDIMDSLDLKSSDTVLDLGCANGYLSVEMAKLAKHVTAIDVNPYVKKIQTPTFLQEKLTFIHGSGEQIDLADASFDVVLASEVLTMIENPKSFLAEIHRLLKPGGRVVFVNGVGRPNIKEMYEKNPESIEKYREKYGAAVPRSYDDYIAKLTLSFGTAIHTLLSEEEYEALISQSAFRIDSVVNSPKKIAADILFHEQFERFVKTGSGLSSDWFAPKFFYLSFLSLFSRERSKSGAIITATKVT
ncbi:class I SAM-dependent methyltransferase [Alteromonas oceanisediminis]|uniref:class I SAM-dependent methyltransferase n=1 Tax=Alteromonas oceanisediminis TaxID=2836180 RepID=UPI001BD9C1CE|nr:class I SAM-dependent methyltransferase [Alteromonas oceanisediminis]MBT0584936.1 methyltransferase domain-containing protein [Alteromonas oceanisediminis]